MLLLKKLKIFFYLAIVMVFIIVLAAIVAGLFAGGGNSDNYGLAEKLKTQKKYEIPEAGNYSLGANNPRITIVEFADFSCPACKNTYPKLREIIFNYAKYVRIVFKDFPVISEDSLALSLAGRCAGEQGLFWPMHDQLFDNQGEINNEKLSQLAKQIGVEENKFNDCLKSEKYLLEIKKDYALGEKLGIGGTPTLFINGYKLAGDIPEEALNKIIEELIAYD
jgi:protein-disulfide isomerase